MKRGAKEIKVEWCENFIRAVFAKIPFENGGISVNLFWDKAEKSGLWVRGTCGTPMSTAVERLTTVETIRGEDGSFLYDVFRLRREAKQEAEE